MLYFMIVVISAVAAFFLGLAIGTLYQIGEWLFSQPDHEDIDILGDKSIVPNATTIEENQNQRHTGNSDVQNLPPNADKFGNLYYNTGTPENPIWTCLGKISQPLKCNTDRQRHSIPEKLKASMLAKYNYPPEETKPKKTTPPSVPMPNNFLR